MSLISPFPRQYCWYRMVRGWQSLEVSSASPQLQSWGWAMWSILGPLQASHGSPSAKIGSVTLFQPFCPFVQNTHQDEPLLCWDAQHWEKIDVVQYPLYAMIQVRLQLQIIIIESSESEGTLKVHTLWFLCSTTCLKWQFVRPWCSSVWKPWAKGNHCCSFMI